MRTLLPFMKSLVFFEASARLGSFTKAADELCVTQSAVSKKIKLLEDSLQFTLFIREPRHLVLTESGREFYTEARSMLHQASDAISSIRRKADTNKVTITCTHAVSQFWLFPQIARFNLQHPDIAVNIYSSDAINELTCSQFELGILNGDGQWNTNLESHLLFHEKIYPICGQRYPIHSLLSPEEVLEEKLIHLDPSAWRWPTWVDWFNNLGIEFSIPQNAQLFNQATLSLEAARQGMGVSLGWEFMTEELLSRNELKRVSNAVYIPGFADYLVYKKSQTLSASAEKLRDWLLKQLALSS